MRRILWASTGLALWMAPALVHAQQSASITLRGYVPEISTVTLEDVSPVISQDIRVPARDALLARVLEKSNAKGGYAITLISANGRGHGRIGLVNPRRGTLVPYRLTYDGTELRFVNGKAEVRRRERTHGQARKNDLRITTERGERLPPGEYSDTITIAIIAR